MSDTHVPNAEFRPKRREDMAGNRFGKESSHQMETGTQLEELEEDDGPIESVGEANDYHSKSTNGFAGFDLPPPLIERMDTLGYKVPFEIQAATLKHTLAGK